MTRDNIIGLVIIAAILIGYSIWMAPTEEERLEARRVQDSIARVRMAQQEAEAERLQREQQLQDTIELVPSDIKATTIEELDSAQKAILQDRMGAFAQAAIGAQEFIVLENEVVRLEISTQGGHVHSAELKEYLTYDQRPLKLFYGEEDEFALHFFAANRSINTANLFFSPEYPDTRFRGETHISVQGEDSTAFAMRLYSDLHTETRPSYIEYFYALRGNDYMVDFHMNVVGMQQVIGQNVTLLNLDWKIKMPQQEKNRTNEQNASTIYYRPPGEDPSRLRETRDDSERIPTSLHWISFKQQFFSSVLIAEQNFANAEIATQILPEEEENFLKRMTASMSLTYAPETNNSYPMRFYFGPNHFQTLKSYDISLERQIPLGWGIFGWINRYAVIPVFNFLDGFGWNYGIIILVLTVMLKLVLMPIAFKTYISQAKMRLLKPELEELSKKFPKKEDAMKKQQATMALYKKAGVNPMSGCVPMLLQLPILIAMFRFFPSSIELRQESFLWATDLSTYDSILDLPFTIPFYGDHVSLFTILMTISTVLYTHLNSKMMGSANQMPGMKTMMYFMPIMLMGFFNNFAAALSYYYFLANIITFGQMFMFQAFVDEDALHRKIEENKKKPVKKSKWQKRMEEISRQQQMAQKKKK
jgi:YidC/Oxa1 family membrane protein insertase